MPIRLSGMCAFFLLFSFSLPPCTTPPPPTQPIAFKVSYLFGGGLGRKRRREGKRGSVGSATVVKGEEKQLPACIANTQDLAPCQLP